MLESGIEALVEIELGTVAGVERLDVFAMRGANGAQTGSAGRKRGQFSHCNIYPG